MKDEHIPPLLGDKVDAAGGLGWLVIGVCVTFACVVGVSLVLIAWPLYQELR